MELPLKLGEHVHDRRLDGHVECGGDLVAHEQLRLRDERPGDGHTLALAAGELVRVPVEAARRELDTIERLRRTTPPVRAGGSEEQAQRLSDDLPDRLARVEGVVGALEDVLDLPTRVGVARTRAGRQRLTSVGDRTRVLRVEPADAACERRLAGARLADERETLARPDRQVDVEQHLPSAVRGADSADGDERFVDLDLGRGHRSRPSRRSVGQDGRMPDAPHDVLLRDELERRLGGTARVLRVGAARREEAAGRAVARDGAPSPVCPRARGRRTARESPRRAGACTDAALGETAPPSARPRPAGRRT